VHLKLTPNLPGTWDAEEADEDDDADEHEVCTTSSGPVTPVLLRVPFRSPCKVQKPRKDVYRYPGWTVLSFARPIDEGESSSGGMDL
jgi:hypothetical protein